MTDKQDEYESVFGIQKCDDADIVRIWRECNLPEYFLVNAGDNHKLLSFAEAIITASPVSNENKQLYDKIENIKAERKELMEKNRRLLVDVSRSNARIAELEESGKKLLKSASILYQSAYNGVVSNLTGQFDKFPGWLLDCEKDLVDARTVLGE